MFRIGIVCCVLLSATSDGASAESPAERGGYLGNCHTPPMAYPFYAGLKQADLADIIAYLRTVPALQ